MQLPDTNDVVLSKLSEGTCPYCNIVGFKMVGAHIFKKHGVRINELKDALLLPRDKGFCSPEESERRRINMHEILRANEHIIKEMYKIRRGELRQQSTRELKGKKIKQRLIEQPERIERMRQIGRSASGVKSQNKHKKSK